MAALSHDEMPRVAYAMRDIAHVRGLARHRPGYAKAQIPKPDTSSQPGSAPAPGRPHDIRAVVEQAGTVQLSWKCRNPTGTRGTIYLIERQVGGSGKFEPLGAVGKRRFVDETLPRGACVGGGGGGGGGVSGVDGMVTYRITAQRSTKRGAPAVYTMQFGGFDAGVGGGVKKSTATSLAA